MITQEMVEAFYSKVEVQKTGAILNIEQGLTAALANLPGEPVAWSWYDSYRHDVRYGDHSPDDTEYTREHISEIKPLYADPIPDSRDAEIAQKAAAFDQIVHARKAYIAAVDAYNLRLEVVQAERKRGNWLNVDPEYAEFTDAQKAFWKITQELADAALSPVGVSGEEKNNG